MKRLLALPLILVAACATLVPVGQVPVEQAEDSTVLLCEEHDLYVTADEALSDDDEAAQLAESAYLRGLVSGEAEFVSAPVYSDALTPVADRYDGYVDSDDTLRPDQKVTMRRTSELLRRLAAEPQN